MNRAWVEAVTGGRVVSARRLHGGLMATTRLVRVETPTGITPFVLRQYDDAPDDVAYEARILQALEAVAIPAPRLVAAEDSALLMSRLPGKVHLAPADLRVRLARMAAPLPVLHATRALDQIGVRIELSPRSYEWVRDPGLRRAAENLMAAPPKRVARVPTHGDYQHFNLLWSREQLSGIVDWSGIWLGPPEIDVCHCRLNLAVLYSADVAEDFRLAYEAEAGRSVDPWHDVHRLGVYSEAWPKFIPIQVHGQVPVRRGMTGRVEELLRRSLSR